MSDFNTFLERFQKLSNTELLKIINDPKDHKPVAIEAARTELKSRNLSPKKIARINAEIETKKQQAIHKKNAGTNKQETHNPTPGEWHTDRASIYIKAVTYTIGAVFIIWLIFGDTSVYGLMVNPAYYSLSFTIASLPYVLIPVGALFFFFRKKAGWIMLCLACTYDSVLLGYFFKKIIGTTLKNNAGLMVPLNEVIINFISILFFAGIALVICRKDLRLIFRISSLTLWMCLSIPVIIAFLQIFRVI